MLVTVMKPLRLYLFITDAYRVVHTVYKFVRGQNIVFYGFANSIDNLRSFSQQVWFDIQRHIILRHISLEILICFLSFSVFALYLYVGYLRTDSL